MLFNSRVLPSKIGYLLFALLAQNAAAINVAVCAKTNTGSSGKNRPSNLQSNGLCSDDCRKEDYVYAITSKDDCWCSNDRPASHDTVDTAKCDLPCPGYPYEFCGGTDQSKLYGYLQLKPDPATLRDSTNTPTPTPTLTSSSDSDSTTTDSEVATSTPTEIVKTVTADGTTRTVIVTPSPTAGTEPKDPVSTHSPGLGGGVIAGIAVGCIAGIAMLAFLFWFLIWRSKQSKQEEFKDDPSIRGSSRGRAGSHQNDLSVAGSLASPGSAGNRSGEARVDPRMDPFRKSLYARHGSTESVNTLRDDHDYSRRIQQPKVLRATNPDPDT